ARKHIERHGRKPGSRQRRQLLRGCAPQRHGQLHQDRAATPCPDSRQPRTDHGSQAARRHVGHAEDPRRRLMHPRADDGIHASSTRQLLRTTQRDASVERSTCTRGTSLALHKASRSTQSRPKQETTMCKLISRMRIPASSGSALLRASGDHDIAIPRLADGESIEIDANGSPVTLEAADWLVCFVPGLRKQWWHALVNAKHKHVFAMRMVDENTWLIMEPWWTRNMVNVLSFDQAVQYLRWAASGDIIKVREAVPGRGSQTRGWSNCAVMVSFLLGRGYRTWSPHGLYKRLKAEQGAQLVDVTRLLADHCAPVANKAIGAVLGG